MKHMSQKALGYNDDTHPGTSSVSTPGDGGGGVGGWGSTLSGQFDLEISINIPKAPTSDPAIPLLGIYARDTLLRHTYVADTAALLERAKGWKDSHHKGMATQIHSVIFCSHKEKIRKLY